MSRFYRTFTGLGATFALIGALVGSGCGTAPRGLAPGMRADMMRAKGTYAVRWQARPMVRNQGGPAPAELRARLEDDAPAAPAGGLKPVPKPTATPVSKPPAEPADGDDVDALHDLLYEFGYDGTRRQLENEIRAKTHAYPIKSAATPDFGWNPKVDSRQHYEWWKNTLKEEVGSYNDYMEQSLQLAQAKFDVDYYVWISKQTDPEKQKREGNPSLFVDLNDGLPVVKGIGRGGWLVEINGEAQIEDYLKIPDAFLRDYNHLVRIPTELYF